METELEPGIADVEHDEKRIESSELAWEMAGAEIVPRARLEIAKSLGLSKESMEELGLVIDKSALEKQAEYEKAMQKADSLLVALLKQEHLGGKVECPTINAKENLEVWKALAFRTQEFSEEEGGLRPKTFKLNSLINNQPKNFYIDIHQTWDRRMPNPKGKMTGLSAQFADNLEERMTERRKFRS